MWKCEVPFIPQRIQSIILHTTSFALHAVSDHVLSRTDPEVVFAHVQGVRVAGAVPARRLLAAALAPRVLPDGDTGLTA